MDPHNAAHQSSSSAEISSESGEVTPAVAANVPASSPAPAPEGSAPAGRGSRHRLAWVPASHNLPDPSSLGPTETKGVVLRSNMAECVVQQGPVVPCIRCLKRWQLDPTEPCRPAHHGSYACQKYSGWHQGCVLVRSSSLYYCWVC